MKKLFSLLMPLLSTLATYSQEDSRNTTITGDFYGNSTIQALEVFLADSLGNTIQHIPQPEGETWDEYIYRFGSAGYKTLITVKGSAIPPLIYNNAGGVKVLFNLGNINISPGDEIAVVPALADQSRHSYCHIYSLCRGIWQEVFVFNVHEDSLDPAMIDGEIYGVLEQRNGVWVFYDYLDMEYNNPEDVGTMLPLTVRDCE